MYQPLVLVIKMGQLLRLPDNCSSACLSGNRGVLHTRTNTNTNSERMRRQIELKSRRNNSAESERISPNTFMQYTESDGTAKTTIRK